MKRSTFLRRGVSVTVDPEKSASFALELIGTYRGARSARLKPARRLRGLVARGMRLTLRITARDAVGNRRIVRRRISIR